MQTITLYLVRLGCWVVVMSAAVACLAPQRVHTPTAQATPPAPGGQAITATVAAVATGGSPLPSGTLASPVPARLAWKTFTHNGISLQYPADWATQIDVHNEQALSMNLHPSNASLPAINLAVVNITKDKANKLRIYGHAGDLFKATGEGSDGKIIWDKQLVINDREWHCSIYGTSGSSPGYELNYLASKGAIDMGIITAAYPIKAKELDIIISQTLEKEMLIELDEKGGDAIFPARFPVLVEMLKRVSVAP